MPPCFIVLTHEMDCVSKILLPLTLMFELLPCVCEDPFPDLDPER